MKFGEIVVGGGRQGIREDRMEMRMGWNLYFFNNKKSIKLKIYI